MTCLLRGVSVEMEGGGGCGVGGGGGGGCLHEVTEEKGECSKTNQSGVQEGTMPCEF